VTVAIVAGSWLAGCATDDDARGGTQNGSAPVTPAPTSTHGSTTEGSTTMTTGAIDPGLQPYIDLAVADLAARQSIDPADITVQAATLEVWSDASLGCPQPGQQYAQVVTDGSLIVLAADGHEFRYHAGGSRTPFLCEAPGKSLTGDTTTTL
jgi:hypothetical protein